MRSISLWARDHVWTSRIVIIFFIYPLLNITGWFLGDLMESEGIHFSPYWGYLLSLTALYLLFIYPIINDKSRYRNFYNRRKIIDALMACTTFLIILFTGNHFNSGVDATPVLASHASTISKDTEKKSAVSKVKKQKKSFKKWVQHVRKKYREADKTTKVLLSILAVLVALLLLGGLIGLACSIACTGSEALAYVVFLLGTVGIIFALVKVINRIHRGPKKKEPVSEPPSPDN